MTQTPELSVVILCYRAEEHLVPYIDNIYKEVLAAEIDFELILVANYDKTGPPDRTPQIAEKFCASHERCTFIAEPKKGMMGWDLRSGLAATRGRYIAFIDGDGQTLPNDVLRLYKLIQRSGADICKLYRTKRADTCFRRITSTVLNFLFAFFFPGWGTRDINGKPKILTRDAYRRMTLSSNDWFADAEIVLEARRLKLKMEEVSGISLPNQWRKSFIGFSATLQFLKNLLVYRFRYWFLK